ncbi:putative UPF0481 protein At3g02645 [Quercus robur]|uniref:putative UPF0481 protein At3g02645 n=1 Tax=Quercus robur TaxID=38942 RepID=UPI002161FAD0|nr:putative UPF0481 protein At3g02645 [Quercus robur]XP_050282439.1 putative UPF0481 protein At3g02645 [Quercus robur]XP_050282440.1 putative UPF0481 protein At3g02645 [Quercus robur]
MDKDLDQLIIDIPQTCECFIYKVPPELRKVNHDAYTPMLISIGPFHHKDEKLKNMEKLKLRYFKEARHRTKKSTAELARCIEEKEETIRHYYAESFDITREDFTNMILLDSIFIIEHLWRTKRTSLKSPSSNGTSSPQKEECFLDEQNPRLSYSILLDLILLENQVPFFVLEDLYNSAYGHLPDQHTTYQQNGHRDEDKPFHKLVLDYFLHFWEDFGLNSPSYNCNKMLPVKDKQIRHFIDFLRYLLLPCEYALECGKSIKRLPCAKKLAEAGVEFREVPDRFFHDIEFKKSCLLEKCPCLNLSWLLSCFPCFKCLENMQPILEIPSFTVGDATERVIRNLMAFEQYHYLEEAYICNYIVLLDHLIDTAEDVDLLVEKKVLVNWLGSNKAVAILINRLSQQIVEGNRSRYHDLSKQLNRHYENCWNKLMASFTSLYFRDFWRGTATVAGILLLFFAFMNFLRPFVFSHR